MRPKSAAAEIEQEVEPNEAVRWADRSLPPNLALSRIFPLIFAVFQTRLAVSGPLWALWRKGIPFSTVSMIFAALGAILFGVTLNAFVAAWRTAYGVTDRRLIEVRAGIVRRVSPWRPQQIEIVQRRDSLEGRGDVTFVPPKGSGRGRTPARAFINVADVCREEREIRTLRQGWFEPAAVGTTDAIH